MSEYTSNTLRILADDLIERDENVDTTKLGNTLISHVAAWETERYELRKALNGAREIIKILMENPDISKEFK